MTQEEWFACTNPQWMIECLRGKAPDAELRTFAMQCCLHALPPIMHRRDDQWGQAYVFIESCVENPTGVNVPAPVLASLILDFLYEIESDNGEIYNAKEGLLAALAGLSGDPVAAACVCAEKATGTIWRLTEDREAQEAEERWQADLLREMFGHVVAN